MKTLIVGSSECDPVLLKKYLRWADRSIACDGGYDHFFAIGCAPDVVLGDQDSIQGDIAPDQRYPKEKNFTDLEAAIHLAETDSQHIIILGVTGGRQDHFLNAVMQLFRLDVPIRIIDSQNEIFVKKTSFHFERTDFPYFSLIPLDRMQLTIVGARYPLDQVWVNPYTSRTISNEPRGRVEVSFDSGRLIVILSRDK